MKNNILLPREYISYSAYSLWKKDRGAFRRRYYENEKPFETAETLFGKTIADHLEQLKSIEGLDVYGTPEHKIEVEYKGIKILGYLDDFDPKGLRFNEFKTGHLSPEGKAPWDRVKVQKHEQLVFYSMLVEMKYGKVDPVCCLKWMETSFINKSVEFEGHTLETQSRELKLTGKILTFKRKIYKWERENLKKEIIKTVLEISNDYKKYIAIKQSNVKARKVIPQKKPSK